MPTSSPTIGNDLRASGSFGACVYWRVDVGAYDGPPIVGSTSFWKRVAYAAFLWLAIPPLDRISECCVRMSCEVFAH
ncbi:unnamed protein product [Calypogeia fissa]